MDWLYFVALVYLKYSRFSLFQGGTLLLNVYSSFPWRLFRVNNFSALAHDYVALNEKKVKSISVLCCYFVNRGDSVSLYIVTEMV